MFTAIRKFDPTYLVEIFDGSEASADNLVESFSGIKEVDYDEIDECAWFVPGGYAGKGDLVMQNPEGNIVVVTPEVFEKGFLRNGVH